MGGGGEVGGWVVLVVVLVKTFRRIGGGGVCATALQILRETFEKMGLVGKVVERGVNVDVSMAGQWW